MEGSELEQTMQELQYLFGVPGWEFLNKHLRAHMERDMVTLASAKREVPDDFLRGRVDVYRWFLLGLPGEVETYFKNKSEEADASRQPEPVGHPYLDEGQPFIEGEDAR